MEAQIIGKKNYGLGYASKGTNYTNIPGTSSISTAMKDIKEKIIK